jgi:peptide/nickel transport system substrate-binding protein
VLQINLNEAGLYFHDSLFDWGPDGKVKPMLVQQKQVSADGLTVTWKLQPNVKFHDGTPFNAAAVKWNLERKIQKKQSPYDLLPFKSVEAVDELTARVKLDRPYPALDAVLANRSFAMYSPSFAQKVGDDGLKTQQSGAGPFILTSFVPNEGLRLKKNPNYWQKGLPYLDEIYIRIVNDINTRATMLAAGDADVALRLSSPDINRFRTAQGIRVLEGQGSQQYYIVMNTRRPGLSDRRVRQAFNYAVDKEGIVQNVYLGAARVAQAMYATPSLDGFAPAGAYPYDPDKAKKLLDEAGWKPGADGIRQKDGARLRLKITTTTGNKLREMVQQVLADQMKRVGVEFYIENVPSSVLFGSWANDADRKKGRYDIMMFTTGPGIDPHQQFDGYFHSRNIPTEANGGSGYNYTRHRDAELDKWLEAGGKSISMADRANAYRMAQKRVQEIVPHIYLYQRVNVHGFRSHVKGWVPNGNGIIDAVETWNIADWTVDKK